MFSLQWFKQLPLSTNTMTQCPLWTTPALGIWILQKSKWRTPDGRYFKNSSTSDFELSRFLAPSIGGNGVSPLLHEKLFMLVMVALRNRADHYIFALWFLYFFFSSPNLSGRRLDVYHTSTHGVALVRISDAGLKPAARGLLEMQDAKKVAKNSHLGTIAQFCRAMSSQLRHVSTIGKKLVKQRYVLHVPTIWWTLAY